MKVLCNFFFILILAFCAIFGACSESTTTTSPAETYESGGCYDAPGEVLVAFDRDVADDFIQKFISNLGLRAEGKIFGIIEKWVAVAVPEGTEDEWIVTLLDYEFVVTAERGQICPVHE